MGDSHAQRRRSPRLTSPPLATVNANKMAPLIAVKRSIVVKKIAPRKTALPSEHDKENVHRTPEEIGTKKPKLSTPGSGPGAQGRRKAAMPSPIMAMSPPHRAALLPPPPPPATTASSEDVLWSNKVRRSYSRLSDQSFRSPNPRDYMFGFEKLSTPEVFTRRALSRSGAEGSCTLSGLGSFTSLMDADESAEPDLNIPGVLMVKEKRRRRKVQKMDVGEVESLAARMNAEFEEAEGFELFVE